MVSEDHRERIKAALLKHHEKELRSLKPSRKNNSPEKDFVKEVLEWSRMNGFDLHVIESKAVYSAGAGRYLSGQAESGMPDLVGNHGPTSVWLEVKAPGRRMTVKPHQLEFLKKKIYQGCFAVVVDNIPRLAAAFSKYLDLDEERAAEFLLQELPKKKQQT